MRLALLSPVHGQSIDHIAQQLDNYKAFLAPFALRHYLHISLDSSPDLKASLLEFADQNGHDIVICKKSRSTWRPCTSNALCELIKTTLKDNINHDKVLIHTDTDLLFSEGIKTHLQQHSIGCGNKPFRFSNRGWKWCSKAKADPRIDRLISEMLDGDPASLRVGRVCGSFMPWDLFKPFGVMYNYYFSDTFFDKNQNAFWPITEIAIPTILQLLAGQEREFQLPLIRNPKEKITRKTISQHLWFGDYFGLKMIGRDPKRKAFRYLKRLQAKATGECF